MTNLEQKLYDQAVYDATFEDVSMSYKEYITDLQRKQEQKFRQNTGPYRASEAEKRAFEERLKNYLTYVIHAHNSFKSKGGQVNRNGELVFRNQASADDFDSLVDEAAKANLSLYDFQKDMKVKAQYGMYEQAKVADKRAEKGKGFLKGLGIAALAATVGGAAWFGTKAAVNKISDSSNDVRQDRIEHRVSVNQNAIHHTAGVRHGTTMDFATDSSGNFVRTQRVAPQRPVVDDADVDMTVQTVTEEEVIEQTKEFTQPQLPQIVEEVVEEVHVPQPQPKVIKKIVHAPAPQPVIQETIEEVHEEVGQATTVVRPRTRVVQVESAPEPVIVQQPVVVDNSATQVAALNNLGNVGVAAMNAWGSIGTARHLSRKGPDVVNISVDKSIRGSFNDNSSRTLVTGNGNDYSDRSVRVRNDSHNLTTTRVDASRRTYAPTTIDASRHTRIDASRHMNVHSTRVDASRHTSVHSTRVDASHHTSVHSTRVTPTRIQAPKVQHTRPTTTCRPTTVRTGRPSMGQVMQRGSKMGGHQMGGAQRRTGGHTMRAPTQRNIMPRGGSAMRRGPSGHGGAMRRGGGRGGRR